MYLYVQTQQLHECIVGMPRCIWPDCLQMLTQQLTENINLTLPLNSIYDFDTTFTGRPTAFNISLAQYSDQWRDLGTFAFSVAEQVNAIQGNPCLVCLPLPCLSFHLPAAPFLKANISTC